MRSERAKTYLLPAAATRRERAMLPFKLVADDSGGLISVCEFTLPGWSSGPVLHRHDAVDEGFFVVTGVLEFQLGDDRLVAKSGDFAWVPAAPRTRSRARRPTPCISSDSPPGRDRAPVRRAV